MKEVKNRCITYSDGNYITDMDNPVFAIPLQRNQRGVNLRMNVLEKILEEIEQEAMTNKKIGRKQCEGMARAMNIIRSHMDEMNNDDWIPVEERLPKETEKEYYPVMYVTTSYGVVAWGFYRVKDEQWYLYNDIMEEFESVENNKIIAWQPLPKPYRPKEKNNGK